MILSFGVVVFGDTINNVLFNKNGEKVYDYGLSGNKTDRKIIDQDIEKKYRPLIDKLWKEAKPGELSILIIPDIYKENKSFYPIQNRDPIYNINDIKNSTSTKFKAPVSNDITFNQGTIRFKSATKFDNTYSEILDSKYKEALDKKMDYIIWTEPLEREAWCIELKYTINKYKIDGEYSDISSPFSLTISRENAVEGDVENASKIEIGDTEGLFIDTYEPEIIYVDSSTEKPLTYHFYFKDSSLKDTIISLIENMQ